jgi:hypothetical protein
MATRVLTPPHPFDEPMAVQAVDGEVVVLGPNGISGSFTVEAARLSARNLLAAAAKAHTQPGPGDERG